MIGSDTNIVDLGGKFVLPGFHDLHVHIEQAYIADMLGDAMMNFPPEETSIKQQHAKNPVAFAAQALEKDGNLNARIALSWTYKGPLESMPLDEDLFAEVEKFDRMGMGITGHATGDAANRQLIDAVAYVKEKYGEVKGRHQLGHATLIHPEDIPRLKELDVTPEFSPVFWYPSGFPDGQRAQLGDDRMSYWYPINSVAQSGGRVTLASDGPLYWHGPLLIMETAMTRPQTRRAKWQ